MISFKEAYQIIQSYSKSFGSEEVNIDSALERVVAKDIYALRDFPPFNRSAMDGIAVRMEDLQNNIKEFIVLETIFAGSFTLQTLKTGECFKIMTGSAVPDSANVVIKVEDTIAIESNKIKILTHDFKENQNIALKGQDLKLNEIAISKGTFINPATVGLLASLGMHTILVEKLPSVSLITTGNEVLELNQDYTPVHIYNSNKYIIKSLLKQNQVQLQNSIHVSDEIENLHQAISQNLNNDILIITGGVSAGEADFVPDILKNLGVEKVFHKVAIKPGKPIWCGIYNHKTMVFALPGNPFSCLVTFKLFVELYIKTGVGIKNETWQQQPLNYDRYKKSNLAEFFPVKLINGKLNKIDINGSGDIRLGNMANALAMHPSDCEVIKTDNIVEFINV